jgi:2-dehydropantoate 2-reductase
VEIDMKIAIMGTGGVGGYFGGLLARAGVDLTFIARGQHLDAISQQGLKISSDLSGEFTIHPNATDDPRQVGPVDLVIYTVKMYHNDQAIPAIAPMVGPETTILTLQNGIDNGDRIADKYPDAHVMIGSAFVQARVVGPGTVAQQGQRGRIVWQKFIYLAGSASVNALSRTTYGEMRALPSTRKLLESAFAEIAAIAIAKGVEFDAEPIQRSMELLDGFPAEGRASLAKDFDAGNLMELEGLTSTIVRLGRELDVPTPLNESLYALLEPGAARAAKAQGR